MTLGQRLPRPRLAGPRGALQLAATLALLAAWWVVLAPVGLGGPATYVVIRGDSMVPTLEGGDLVIVRADDAYAQGDVVAYRVPGTEIGAGRIVIHRIVGGDDASGYVLRGDNNPAPDPWLPRDAEIIGSAWLRIALLGRFLETLFQPAVAGSLAAAIVVGVVTFRRERRLVGAILGERRSEPRAIA